MRMTSNLRTRLGSLAAFALASSATSAAFAACPDHPRAIYGGGGSAVTATLANVATALRNLPEGEDIAIYFADPGACAGYQNVVQANEPAVAGETTYKYWEKDGSQKTCSDNKNKGVFAHMGNTPALCPAGAGDVLPSGWGQFVAPVQTINFIVHKDSTQNAISGEALYHLFGFGPGGQDRSGTGRGVSPWTNENVVYGRSTNSFVHQIIAGAIGVSATHFTSKVLSTNVLGQNPITVKAVYDAGQNSGNYEQPIGYVSGSAADLGESDNQIKTLAYQHFGQDYAYLPDSSRTRKDKLNARNGQYFLWTPAWIYAQVDAQGKPSNELVGKLIGWFDGSLPSPAGSPKNITEIIIQSGDIPLCAMRAIRPSGDLSAIQSYAPADPCNGYFEYVATGSTEYQSCTNDAACTDEDYPACRQGFCEAY